jgi:hypothetical protein
VIDVVERRYLRVVHKRQKRSLPKIFLFLSKRLEKGTFVAPWRRKRGAVFIGEAQST